MSNMAHPTPRLKRLDMRQARGHLHPQVRAGRTYLAKIDGAYFVGQFSHQWYGLSFLGWHGTAIQFDAPGTNASTWQQLWEIVA